MITIDGKNYFSRYKPADKRFFLSLARADHYLKKRLNEFDEDSWSRKWDLKYRLQEAKDVLDDNPKISKEVMKIILSIEYDMMEFSDDLDIRESKKIIDSLCNGETE